jgi:hypothetical protein
MKKTSLALAAMSLNAMAANFVDHVQKVKAERPMDGKKIDHVAILTQDLVIHYEQAVILGTSKDYEERTLIGHFEEFLRASDEQCDEINLTGCIYDLICEEEVNHNLKTSIMPCD